jgi:hypothetical protein
MFDRRVNELCHVRSYQVVGSFHDGSLPNSLIVCTAGVSLETRYGEEPKNGETYVLLIHISSSSNLSLRHVYPG